MKKLNYLIEVANSLEMNDVLAELDYIKNRLNSETSELVLPIVGEFSSGKTTLINAISDGKNLETSSRPTTSVIYEIFSGRDSEYAELIKMNGEIIEEVDVSKIKNADLTEIDRIRIFDTNKKIDQHTILVDTPGLSSNDPKHLEALSRYLPNADALILCVDANQQITNSLLEFIKFNNLAHLPLYLVITKTDTKTSSEIEKIKEYILKNVSISADKIIFISAIKNDLSEFYSLIQNIQENKNKIINNVLDFRLDKIKEYLKEYIKNLLDHTTSDKTIENEINQQQRSLVKLLDSINRLIQDTRSEMEEVEYETIKSFNYLISDKLDGIVGKNSANSDYEAVGIINSTSNLIMNNYQNEIRKKLYLLANERKNTDLGVPLRSLESINIEDLQMSPLSYDIDLSSAGQEYVKNISTGIKIAAVVGAIAVTAGMAAAAAPATGAGAAATGAATGAVTGAATSAVTVAKATRVARLVTNAGVVIKTVKDNAKGFKENMEELNKYNTQGGQIVAPNQNQGFVENIVGKVGDSVLGKPQRKKMINNYMDSSLIPEFKAKLNAITNNVLQDIQDNLDNEAQLTISQIEFKLTELKELFLKEDKEFKSKIESYRNQLNILNQ